MQRPGAGGAGDHAQYVRRHVLAAEREHPRRQSRWRRVANATLPGDAGPWAELLRRARPLPRAHQLSAVNTWVNHAITFTDDAKVYKVSDHWAGADESLRSHRGDCEDYAIAKYQLLRALGVPSRDLYLVIVRDLVRRADHAVLAVRTGSGFQILDSGGDAIFASERVQDYRPLITYSADHAWIHGYRRAAPTMVASAAQPAGARGGGSSQMASAFAP